MTEPRRTDPHAALSLTLERLHVGVLTAKNLLAELRPVVVDPQRSYAIGFRRRHTPCR